jgi:hypothetical protein
MTVFDDIAAQLAVLLNIDVTSAGYILGIITILTVFVVTLILQAMLRSEGGKAPIMGMGLAFVAVVLFGWFPLWTVVFLGLILIFLMISPFLE